MLEPTNARVNGTRALLVVAIASTSMARTTRAILMLRWTDEGLSDEDSKTLALADKILAT